MHFYFICYNLLGKTWYKIKLGYHLYLAPMIHPIRIHQEERAAGSIPNQQKPNPHQMNPRKHLGAECKSTNHRQAESMPTINPRHRFKIHAAESKDSNWINRSKIQIHDQSTPPNTSPISYSAPVAERKWMPVANKKIREIW